MRQAARPRLLSITLFLVAVTTIGCTKDADNDDRFVVDVDLPDAEDVERPPGPDVQHDDATSDVDEETTRPDVQQDAADQDADAQDCISPQGCWACEPETSLHILNRCTESACEPFDNSARLPLLSNPLPPLP